MAVVHAEHDGDHGWLIGNHVALQPDADRTAGAAGYLIATPAGIDEANPELWETRSDVGLRERCIQPMIGDAVTVEYDGVSVLQIKIGLLGEGGGSDEC